MKSSRQYSFFRLLYIIYLLDSVIGTDSIYERVSGYIEDSDYIDPQSLYYNRQSQTVKAPRNCDLTKSENSQLAVQGPGRHSSCKDSSYEVFSRRLVNMIISKSNFKIDGGIALGTLELEATIAELEILKLYGEGKLSIRQIDDILTNVIRPTQISFFDEALNFTDRISIYIYQHRIIFGSMLVVLFVIIIALKVQWTRFRIVLLLFDVAVIVSFMLTWWELLQEAEIKLAAQRNIYYTMPDECRQDKISFFTSVSLFFGFGKGDCLKYFEAVMTDPVLKVTPLHAFSHMSSKFFLYPLSLASHYLSDFIEGLTRDLPFPFNIIAKALLIMFMPVLLGVLLIIYLGGSMGLRIGPFFHLYLHSNNTTTPKVSLENPHRQAIEVIQSDVAEIRSNISTNSQPSTSTSQNSPKQIKATQTDAIAAPKVEKQEDSDNNSDEFPEEKEYEKISRTRLEDEIKKETLSGASDSNFKKETSQNENELIAIEGMLKNKISLGAENQNENELITSEEMLKNKTSLDTKN